MTTFTKQPRDVLDYDVDMATWFSAIAGDNIQSVDIQITCDTEPLPTLVAGPLPHQACTLVGANPVRFKMWLGGGTDYMEYTVTCVVLTEQDRIKEIEFKMKVRNK